MNNMNPTNASETRGELMCSGRISSSCYTSCTRRVTPVTNPVNKERTGKCSRLLKHNRGNLSQIFRSD